MEPPQAALSFRTCSCIYSGRAGLNGLLITFNTRRLRFSPKDVAAVRFVSAAGWVLA